jgi:hypothetical protein
MGDVATRAALEADKGKTTEALRQDRAGASATPSAQPPTVQPMEIERQGGLQKAPTGFDPYLINGRGANADDDPIEYNMPGSKPPIECGPVNCPRCCCC